MTRFQTTRRIEFCETDAAGIAHFSAFFIYMEQAEHELLRHLGFSVMMADDGVADDRGKVSWPRVSASCDYRKPIKFEEVMDVAVSIERMGEKSVAYCFEFTHNGSEIATGKITSVCCRILPGQPPQGIPIPEAIVDKLRDFIQ